MATSMLMASTAEIDADDLTKQQRLEQIQMTTCKLPYKASDKHRQQHLRLAARLKSAVTPGDAP